jgi:hypothetical protein
MQAERTTRAARFKSLCCVKPLIRWFKPSSIMRPRTGAWPHWPNRRAWPGRRSVCHPQDQVHNCAGQTARC